MTTVDHHYIPKFYLKRWANPADGMITTFEHRYEGLRARPSAPAGTGYEKHLYTAKLNPKLGDSLETDFMQRVDNDAAEVLDIFCSSPGAIPPLSAKHLNGWSQFLMSLMHRSPGRIDELQAQVAGNLPSALEKATPDLYAEYDKFRRPGDPPTLPEYLEKIRPADIEYGTLRLVAMLSDSPVIGTALNRMKKHVVRFAGQKHELLTSDRPLIMSGPLNAPDVLLALALSPTQLFIAAHTDERLYGLQQARDNGELVKFNNLNVCRQAERFVYATSTAQRSFITKYFPALRRRTAERARTRPTCSAGPVAPC